MNNYSNISCSIISIPLEKIIEEVKEFTNSTILKWKKKDPLVNVIVFTRDPNKEKEVIEKYKERHEAAKNNTAPIEGTDSEAADTNEVNDD